MKLEEFILSQLYILGAVAIGIAFLQVKPHCLILICFKVLQSAEL